MVDMSPFERRLLIVRYMLKVENEVTSRELLDNNVVDINQAGLNSLLNRLVRDGFITSVGTSTYTRYYRPTEKSKKMIKA